MTDTPETTPAPAPPPPEEDPGYGERAPTLKEAFIGYGSLFGGIIGLALLLVLLMKVLR